MATWSHPAACRPASHAPMIRSRWPASRSRSSNDRVLAAGIFLLGNPRGWPSRGPRRRPKWAMAARLVCPARMATRHSPRTDASGYCNPRGSRGSLSSRNKSISDAAMTDLQKEILHNQFRHPAQDQPLSSPATSGVFKTNSPPLKFPPIFQSLDLNLGPAGLMKGYPSFPFLNVVIFSARTDHRVIVCDLRLRSLFSNTTKRKPLLPTCLMCFFRPFFSRKKPNHVNKNLGETPRRVHLD